MVLNIDSRFRDLHTVKCEITGVENVLQFAMWKYNRCHHVVMDPTIFGLLPFESKTESVKCI